MLLQSLHFRQAIIEIKSHDQSCLTINHKLIFFTDFFVYKVEILVFETSVKSESVKFCNSKAAICHRAKVWLAFQFQALLQRPPMGGNPTNRFPDRRLSSCTFVELYLFCSSSI